jgi:copper(I)-binding protein
MSRIASLAAASLLFLHAHAFADVVVGSPWIRATVPAQKTAGAFMQLQATAPTRLVQVASPVARRIEIHAMSMDGGTMRMRAVDGVDLPANRNVDLAGGSYHLMLLDLQRQLKEGENVALTLIFVAPDGKRENLTVDVPVKSIAYRPAASKSASPSASPAH